MGLRVVSSHSSQTPRSTEAFSPQTARKVMLCLFFQLDNHPFEQDQCTIDSSSLESSYAFAFNISPLIGIDYARATENQMYNTLSTSGRVRSRFRFFLLPPELPFTFNESLFLMMEDRVLGAILNSAASSFFFLLAGAFSTASTISSFLLIVRDL